MNDEEIFDAIRLGLSSSGKAYDILFKKSNAGLSVLTKRLGLNESDLEDALHEAITDFYLRIEAGSFKKGKAKITTYIYGVTKNKLIDLVRKRKGEFNTEIDELYFIDYQTPESIFFAYEQVGLLKELLDTLGESCRHLIIDHFGPQKLSYAKLAEKYGYNSPEVVGTTIYRCKQKLIGNLLSNKVLLGKMMDAFDNLNLE